MHSEGMLQHWMLHTKRKNIPCTFSICSCVGESGRQGVDRRIYGSGCWNWFSQLIVLTSILFKDRDSPKDTQQSGASLLHQNQDIPAFLYLVSNTFKSLFYAMKSSGKHLLGSLNAVSKDGIKVYLQRNGEFHDRKTVPG